MPSNSYTTKEFRDYLLSLVQIAVLSGSTQEQAIKDVTNYVQHLQEQETSNTPNTQHAQTQEIYK